MTPLEMAACAGSYAGFSTLIQGVPFSGLIALGAALGAALSLRVINLTRPPDHAVHWILCMIRPSLIPVMLDPDHTRDRNLLT